jgi:hypothetical protein
MAFCIVNVLLCTAAVSAALLCRFVRGPPTQELLFYKLCQLARFRALVIMTCQGMCEGFVGLLNVRH